MDASSSTYSTLDHCNLEQCYVKLSRKETESEANDNQSSFQSNHSNLTGSDDYENWLIDNLVLISKDCHTAELKCSMCSNLDDCNRQGSSSSDNNLGEEMKHVIYNLLNKFNTKGKVIILLACIIRDTLLL